jgi:hypothetical protein
MLSIASNANIFFLKKMPKLFCQDLVAQYICKYEVWTWIRERERERERIEKRKERIQT